MSESKFTWLKIAFILYSLIGFVFAIVIGYCTHTVLSNLGDATHFDSIDKVRYSFIDQGTLNICVSGVLAGNIIKQRYQLSVPLDKVIKYEHKKDDLSNLENYYLDRQFISDECSKSDKQQQPEQIETPVVNIPKALEKLDIKLKRNSVYEVSKHWGSVDNKTMGTKGKRILYIAPINSTDNAVIELKTKSYKGTGSKNWLWVIPFALIADTLTFPVQIAMWVNYASAH